MLEREQADAVELALEDPLRPGEALLRERRGHRLEPSGKAVVIRSIILCRIVPLPTEGRFRLMACRPCERAKSRARPRAVIRGLHGRRGWPRDVRRRPRSGRSWGAATPRRRTSGRSPQSRSPVQSASSADDPLEADPLGFSREDVRSPRLRTRLSRLGQALEQRAGLAKPRRSRRRMYPASWPSCGGCAAPSRPPLPFVLRRRRKHA